MPLFFRLDSWISWLSPGFNIVSSAKKRELRRPVKWGFLGSRFFAVHEFRAFEEPKLCKKVQNEFILRGKDQSQRMLLREGMGECLLHSFFDIDTDKESCYNPRMKQVPQDPFK